MQDLPEIMSAKQVADFLGVSYNTVRIWREKERGPEYIRRGYKGYFYRREDVLAFAKEFNYDVQM